VVSDADWQRFLKAKAAVDAEREEAKPEVLQ
jgi:hypothetical protein